ncbi:MAG: glycosyltransferase [Ignavibacteriales bacterium]|nr:glycosyltransferase [Ignavibacteriales bacterium]
MILSVIIVNYNVRAFLETALVSVQKAMRNMEGEIFVVDNASNDGSAEMVQAKFPDVHLIANKINVGFSKANNLALKQARGKYILLLNPDTIVQEDTFEVMASYFEKEKKIGLATCKILNPDGTLQLACRRSFPTPFVAFSKLFGLSDIFPQSKLFGRYNLTYLSPKEESEVDAVSGAFMFLRKEVYDNVGGLDEKYFMYGEDLDWCYRIQKSGWKVRYVPSTQIIHYKGESTRRSSIDEVKIFYQSMELFVKKHFRSSSLFLPVLRSGIVLRSWIASIAKMKTTIGVVCLDSLLVTFSLIAAEIVWRGRLFSFPPYAYPSIYIFSILVILSAEYIFGSLTKRRTISSSSAFAVFTGYVILSAFTFFFKDYGFSRMVTIISGVITIFLLPGWRFIFHLVERIRLTGKRSLIVGTNQSGEDLLKKLRTRIENNYEVVGFIDSSLHRVGETIGGIQILGSVETIGRVIREQKVTDVIFSTDALSYMDILSVIAQSRDRNVNYRLVPSSLDVIIGKTRIDELESIPLIDIAYNIHQPLNRFVKRIFDVLLSTILLCTIFPLVKIFSSAHSSFQKNILLLPHVFKGKKSFVGRPEFTTSTMVSGLNGKTALYLGKIGLTGLPQINADKQLTYDEIETYNLYYAKNQSLLLDVEILLKSFFIKK